MNAKIDLINGGIQHSNLFLHMPLFDQIFYDGLLEGKVRRYSALREDQTCRILVINVIRKDEDIIWDAAEDMIKRAVADAAGMVHGVFSFDLLTMDFHQEVKTFNPAELMGVLIKHAQKQKPGEMRLIKYSSVYGLFQKLVHEDWGKISFKTAVEVFKDKPHFLDLLIKRLIKNFEFANDPGILLLNDLSQQPLFDPEDAQQQERLTAMIRAQIPKSIDFPPEVYIQDKNGVRELLSGMIIK